MNSATDDKPELSRSACRVFDVELSAFLEGEPRPEVERHARDCVFCSVVLADLEAIREASLALPTEDPPARLWTNVRAALAAEGIVKEPVGWFERFPGFAWFEWATPIGTLAVLAITAGLLMRAPGRLQNNAPANATISVTGPVPPDLTETVSVLEQNYAAREAQLDPALKATYRKSLDSLNDSIKECRATVEAKPSDTLAQEYLLAAYTEKAEVLQSALEMDAR
jgi:hypothetical protein